ncbi:MAG TPA: LysM peptidoglycan-binding domain-containing protein [Anaerolineales bacterium]|nr:LysM peptidoglycan-binding domain-containing protein [Anaerolineales bacterium]
MSNTRGNLVAARIFEVDDSGEEKSGGVSVDCMFNPFEYTVTKQNTFEDKTRNNSNVPQVEFKKAGSQTLKLALVFDTFEAGENVTLTTNQLWKFMEPKTRENSSSNAKTPPPDVAFEWGVFRFVSVITQMSQKFTMFQEDGTPVRAKVDVTFTQHRDTEDYPNQNPTSGGGEIEQVRTVIAGERLDSIAYDVYGDATRWRQIADRNGIRDPLAIKPGQILTIPPRSQ